MSETKEYSSFVIPNRSSINEKSPNLNSPKEAKEPNISLEKSPFAEVKIELDNVSSSYEAVPIPQASKPEMDEKRKLFISMRDISRCNHSSYFLNTKFYHKQAQYENSKVFYKQAKFMKDFEDDYSETVSFSSYFPYYQLMSYEQLRTYFTWRTKVRKGVVENISLSYAFVYIYELLNNIGVDNPIDGLNKLVHFWDNFKTFDKTIDKYLLKWIKDYHIYYGLPKPFKAFIYENELQVHYPDISNYEPNMVYRFDRLCDVSKYNIKKSIFYNDNTEQMISNCFDYVISELKTIFAHTGIELNQLIFQSANSKASWTPFQGALFYPTLKQQDRKVVLCEKEVYICSQNQWSFSTVIAIDSGKQLIGYILKQMEVVLRKITKFKYKLSADYKVVDEKILKMLSLAGVSLEKSITDAVFEFYKEMNKTIVTVDVSALKRIRLEALDTQEKLIVPENDVQLSFVSTSKDSTEEQVKDEIHISTTEEIALSDGWISLKQVLTQTEIQALSIVLKGNQDIKQFADENKIMLEVLADNINDKAFDHIGDSILEMEDSMTLYDEYRGKIMVLVGLKNGK